MTTPLSSALTDCKPHTKYYEYTFVPDTSYVVHKSAHGLLPYQPYDKLVNRLPNFEQNETFYRSILAIPLSQSDMDALFAKHNVTLDIDIDAATIRVYKYGGHVRRITRYVKTGNPSGENVRIFDGAARAFIDTMRILQKLLQMDTPCGYGMLNPEYIWLYASPDSAQQFTTKLYYTDSTVFPIKTSSENHSKGFAKYATDNVECRDMYGIGMSMYNFLVPTSSARPVLTNFFDPTRMPECNGFITKFLDSPYSTSDRSKSESGMECSVERRIAEYEIGIGMLESWRMQMHSVGFENYEKSINGTDALAQQMIMAMIPAHARENFARGQKEINDRNMKKDNANAAPFVYRAS